MAGDQRAARGEFSIVIAGLAVAAGIEPSLGPLATAYVLLLVVLGPLAARCTEPLALRVRAALSSDGPSPLPTTTPLKESEKSTP